ncbi:helix-turn-helix domain-containing protein [Kitasatospora sp. NPDC087314]|uniref:helix-turn-helix domain-containing protein n=1 Tax=Kitasatospora sp. NPDC087314 TaxID=3364068 RepID=UPI00380E42F0
MPLLPAPASARLRFGHRLRHWREARGLSQTELGRLLGYHNSLISRVENARRWPPPGLPARADELLLTGGELAALWQPVRRERERLGELAAPARPPFDGAGPGLSADRPDAVTFEVLGHLLDVYRAAATHIGGEQLTAVLEHHTRTLAGWQHTTPRGTAPAVRSLAARYAELAGWAHFEGDRRTRALGWYAAGLEWARAADDQPTTAALLARQSTLHWWSGDPAAALALAEAAHAVARSLPGLRAWAALAQAHAHALAGAAPAAWRALAEAERLTETARRAGEPTPRPARADLVLGVAHGTCHRDLAVRTGRSDHAHAAVAHLGSALGRLDPAVHPHDHALIAGRLAGAYARAGRREAAAAVLSRLPPDATGRIAYERRRARAWLGGSVADRTAADGPSAERPSADGPSADGPATDRLRPDRPSANS